MRLFAEYCVALTFLCMVGCYSVITYRHVVFVERSGMRVTQVALPLNNTMPRGVMKALARGLPSETKIETDAYSVTLMTPLSPDPSLYVAVVSKDGTPITVEGAGLKWIGGVCQYKFNLGPDSKELNLCIKKADGSVIGVERIEFVVKVIGREIYIDAP